MKEEIAKLWVEALRSGAYSQAKYALCKEYSDGCAFCCLGVLCELYVREKNEPDSVHLLEDLDYERISNKPYRQRIYYGHTSVLPQEVVQWAGLNSATPSISNVELSSLNDTFSKSFSEIADSIELHFDTM